MFQLFPRVKKLKIFEGIEENVVEEILKNAQRKDFLSGETIMEQGDVPDGCGYIIENGKVQVIIDGENKKILSEGEIFGEIALLNEEARSATIITLEDTKCIILSQEMLFEMINHDDNSINKEIMRRIEENIAQEETEGV